MWFNKLLGMSTLFGFEELEVWKKCRLVKNEILITIKSFPDFEKFRMADQLSRSVRSIGSLIAEGHGRFSYPDQIHYFIQARGSLSESMSHLIDARDENYISESLLQDYRIKLKEIERMLNGYLNYLRSKKDLKSIARDKML
jgi:four helix bundle protein